MPPIDQSKVQWDDPAPQIDASKVQWDDAPTTPQPAERPGLVGAAVRGFKRSLPETKMLGAGALAAVGGALGLDGVRDYGLDVYRDTQKDVAKEQGPSFADVRQGKAGVGEYVGDVVGNFAGQGLQSAVAAGVGAALGSEAPGVGNVAGAIGGVVAKGAIKRELAKRAEHMLADQAAKGLIKEGGEAAARGAIERKLTRQLGAGVGTAYGLNAAQEAGTIYGSRADDAAQQGEQLDRGDAVRALGFGGVSGAVDTAAEAFGVGRLFGGASGSKSLVKRVLAGSAKGALTEGGTEATQAVLERAGAGQSLTDAAAREDYLENFAAGAVGGGVLGAPSGVRRHLPGHETPQPGATQTTGNAQVGTQGGEPPPPPLNPANGPTSRVVNEAVANGAIQEAAERQAAVAAAQAPQQEQYRLPPPPWVDPDTGAMLEQPDLATAKAYVHEHLNRLENEGGEPLNRGQWKRELGISNNLFANTVLGEVKRERAKGLRGPEEYETPLLPQNVPWVDAQTGAQRQPTDDELKSVLHESFNASADGVPNKNAVEGALWKDYGITRERTGDLWKQVVAERKAGHTAPVENADATSNRAEPAAADVGAEGLFPSGEDRGAPAADQGGAESDVQGGSAPALTQGAQDARERPGTDDADLHETWRGLQVDRETRDNLAAALSQGVDPTNGKPLASEGFRRQYQDELDNLDVAIGTAEDHLRANNALNEIAVLVQRAAQSAPADVHAAAHEAATSPQNDLAPPTPAQVEAGNFKVGRIKVNGLDISIEHPAGVKRNPKHSRALAQAYGYIRRTEGADGEKVDVFLGDHAADTSKPVFVIDQKKADGSFDEHKAMLGFDDEAAARAAYLANYPRGWDKKGLGGIRQMSQDEFKAWVQNPEQTKQPAAVTRTGSPVRVPNDHPFPTASVTTKPSASAPVRRGEVGGKLGSGEVVLTSSGRSTSPFPQIKTDTNRKSANTERAVEKWLMQNALDEARARGDEFNARQFEANLNKPSQSDKDGAEEYLFGEQPSIPPSITKPLTAATEAATESPAEQKAEKPDAVDEAAVRADYNAAMQKKTGVTDFDYGKGTFGDLIVGALKRDPAVIESARDSLTNGRNETGLRVFFQHAGMKMPRTQREQKAAFDAYIGVSAEQRAASDKARADKKQSAKDEKTANARARQPIPDFKTAVEADRWWRNRAEAFPSQAAYRATPEYAEFLQKVKPLYEQHNADQQKAKGNALAQAGLKAGDRVETNQYGSMPTDMRFTGTLVMRMGIPWVQLDQKQTVSRKGKLSETSRVRWTADWKKVGAADATETATAVHVENGEETPATPAEIQHSAEVAERAPKVTMAQAKTDLLKQIDAAIAVAPVVENYSPESGGNFTKEKQVEIDAAGFVTFDVDGDGSFKVRNIKSRLQQFRKQVESQFKMPANHPVPKPAEVKTREKPETLLVRLAKDNDYENLALQAEAFGQPLRFGLGQDSAKREVPTAYAMAEPVKIGGEDFFVGLNVDNAKDAGKWYAIHVATGLHAGGAQATREAALSEAKKKVEANPDKFATAVTEAMKKNPMPDAQRDAAWRKLRNVPAVETEREPATPGPETARAKVAEATSAEGKIEDFGEKISGARKDAAREYAQRLTDAKEVDVATNPLSKSWPEPDYQALLDAGADPWAVSFAHTARDEIPTKPSKSWKLKGWVAQVTALRNATQLAIESDATRARLRERWDSAEFASLRKSLEGRRELYQTFGHAVSLKGVSFAKHTYSYYRGEKNVTKWSIDRAAKATAFSNWPQELAVGDTKEQALEVFKAVHAKMVAEAEKPGTTKPKAPTKFDVYSRRLAPGKWIIGKKIGTEYFDLATFDSPKEAREYLQDNQAELERKLAAARDIPSERKADNAPRVGIDHRNGADVTPEQFGEAFGFRGVQFGNYVEGPRRQADLNRAYDALMDMAGILGLPARALSLNGELGLAFGARGTGGKNPAAAHYEAGQVVINLTKGSGPGSLAHEWFHALDNYFSRMGGKRTGFVTDPNRNPGTEGLRPEMVQAFKSLMAAIHETRLRERSRELDKRRGKPYWSTDLEMAARSFESYMLAKLADQNAANDYLVNVLGQGEWEALTGPNSYPYHIAEDVPAIRAAFDHFFQTVQTREAEGGRVALFSRAPARAAAGLDRNRAQRFLTQLTAKWGDNAPQIRLVESAEELQRAAGLPREVLTDPDFYRAEGLYDGRPVVFLNLARIPTPKRFAEVLAHEALGHFGVERVIGKKEWARIAATIQRHVAAGTGDKDLRRAIAQVQTTQPGLDADTFAKEVVAVMAEQGARNGIIRDVVARVLRFLRQIMPTREWSATEIRDLIARADSFLHAGRTAEQRRAVVQRYAFSSGETAPTFHSAALAAIEAGKGAPKRADAAAWKGWLDGAVRRGDMKQSERDWLGLDDWLAKQGGQVSRDQLAGFVRANQVQVQDVVLGGDAQKFKSAEQRLRAAGFSIEADDYFGVSLVDEDGQQVHPEDLAPELRADFDTLEEGQDADNVGVDGPDGAKFGQYQLPGGENYRELLLTLPSDTPDRASAPEYYNATSNDFRSSHFDQPNILAHVRFNERTDADRKRVLFLEEIQSDWHQQGRKNGYASASPLPYFAIENKGSGHVAAAYPTKEEAYARLKAMPVDVRLAMHVVERVEKLDGVPDAPFKGSDEWSMLAFKRMVRWAAEHGFDRIAWTTGEQQADRYDLSKEIRTLSAVKLHDGDYGISAAGYSGDGIPGLRNKRVKESELEGLVGKELAEKIIKGEGGKLDPRTKERVYTGLDLKVGGEGMRGFYDNILPKAVNKWAKRFGARAADTVLSGASNKYDYARTEDRRWIVLHGNAPVASFATRDEAVDEVDRRNDAEPVKVHAIDLTPAMREAALAGQPLFSSSESGEIDVDPAFVAGLSEQERKSPAMAAFAHALYASMGTDSPFFRNWFGDSKVVDADGNPVRSYHGTNEEFAAFDPNRLGKSTNHMTAALGVFFDTRKSKAEHYARVASNDVPAEQVLLDGYLSIQKPYAMSKDEFMSIDSVEKSRALRARLQAEGYDGIKLPDIGQWIAFKPEQFKTADNRGTFDPADRRMLFSKSAADVVDDIEADLRAVNAEVEGDQSIVGRAKAMIQSTKPGNLKETMRRGWLGALTLRHLTELGSDYFPTMRIYSDYLSEMAADRNSLQEEAEGLAEGVRKWAGKNRAEAARMFDIMHKATIQGVDPAESYQPLQFRASGQLVEVNKKNVKDAIAMIREQMRERSGENKTDMIARAKGLKAMLAAEPARKASYPSLVEAWNQLSPEAKQHYRAMRDMYAKRSEQTEAALIQRINDLKMEGGENHKRVLIHKIREQFESQRLQGVYFPLQRFGRYFVAAERNGASTFLMYENPLDLKKAVAGLRKRGFSITAQGMKQEGKAKDAPSGTFVAEVIEALRKAHVSDQTQDQIYQIYLQALPEMSMRKHSIHRKSVPGFDPDAIRAFAYNMFHGAHQLARLRYSHKLADTITVLQGQQAAERKKPDADTKRVVAGDAILEELDRRHEWIANPQDSKASNLVSSAGFAYYLGATPAAAMVNLTQTALVSFPFLASRYGGVKAMTHLLAGMRDSIRTAGHIERTLTDQEEVRAHQTLQHMGALDKTQAHNLAGIAEGGLTGYNPGWARAMKIIGWGFHKTEVVNREATGMATFRLARAEGKSFDEAVRAAADAITETHFDYTNANRARYMQNGTAKVLLMFRQYSLNMTWHLGRMVWQATKAVDPLTRKIARRNLAGILGMSALFSGVLGLPLMSVTMGLLNAIAASAGDDDEPWDAETEFRAFLVDMLGQDVASVLLGGVANKVTGADIASRVSLSQLWFRDADRELDGKGAYYNLLEQAAGPMGGVLKNALVGKQLVDEGHVMRGVETMLPKSLKDGVKAARYATQGANTLRGDPIVADLSLRQTLLQLAGFTPSEVADRYDTNRSLKNYERAILERRQHLIDAYAMALRLGDASARTDAVAAIRNFNRTNREVAITPKTLRSSLAARMRYSKRAENGIVLNPKLAARLRARVEGGED